MHNLHGLTVKRLAVKSEPLTDAEFERLSGILGRFDNKQPMNLEQLDGFLAALICGPEIVRQANIFL